MKSSVKILHWLPRILCILAILFISMFAADAFAPGLSTREQLAGFFMHLIPTFILVALLILAWKRELLGGILFTVIGIGLSPVIYTINYSMNGSVLKSMLAIVIITVPFILVGVLFIINHYLKRKKSAPEV